MNADMNYNNWRVETDAEGIWWLHIDQAGSGTNVLNVAVIEELEDILNRCAAQKPLGVVFLSDKKNGFIAGADIKEFTQIHDMEMAVEHIRRGQAIMDKIEAMSCPTVALIHGFCMGGGLELALACRYRIADDGPSTRLGLPEVQLGIHPGFGGSLRLPRLIGAPAAMDLMLTGKSINARKAKKLGLLDYAVPTRHFISAARKVIIDKPRGFQPSRWQRWSNNALARPLLAKMMRKQVAKKARPDHYPAPYALIDLWAKHIGKRDQMLREEAQSVARLVIGETSKNLVKVFFLREQLKARGKLPEHLRAQEIRHVHVVGAGVMGGDIAAWCALRGLDVTLQDRSEEVIAKALQRANKLFKRKLRGDRLGIIAARDRLLPDMAGLGVAKADIVIEAIVENIEAKQGLYRDIEPRMKPGALLTTNTSSIPLQVLGEALNEPGRLVGLHFFNPVAQMPLIEIVTAEQTDAEAAQRVAAFAKQIGKLPLPVKSAPGFLVNRILMPYMMEAVRMREQGLAAAAIDQAAVDFGMPMGPLHLADTVGLDICLSVAEILGKELNLEIPGVLRDLVGQGKLGVKSGQGFYHYDKAGKRTDKASAEGIEPEIIDRLMARLLNEAMACLREGVVENRELLDAGIIFGTGFAPFRGGPINYAEHEGFQAWLDKLQRLEHQYGKAFHPDPGWEQFTGQAAATG